MIWVIVFGLITVGSVIAGLKKRKPLFFLLPFGSLFAFMLVKVIMVPLPFIETVRFIFYLKG